MARVWGFPATAVVLAGQAMIGAQSAGPSAVQQLARDIFKELIEINTTDATDGHYLRVAGIPTYGVSGLFDDVDDVRAHGKDERMGVRAFNDGLEFMYRLVKTLSSGEGRRDDHFEMTMMSSVLSGGNDS